MGLVATVVLSDVALTWAANTEPDLAGYAVLRDGVRVAETTPPTMTDVGLANGGYEYRAIAIDAVGNESPPSTPVTATVAAPVSPPSSPVITGPTDAANPIAQSEITTDVGGFGPPGSDVILEVNGGFAGSGTTGDGGYVEVGATDLPAGAIFRAMARDGSSFVYFGEDGAYLVDTATQLPVELTPASHDEIVYVSYSGDGRKLASLALAFDPITGDEIRDTTFVRDLATGVETIVLDTDAELWEAILSPAGDRLSYVEFGDLGARLRLVDLAAGTDVEIASAGFEIAFTSWSPDDQLIAHARFEIEGDPGQLFLHDPATGLSMFEANDCDQGFVGWSPDGQTLACTGLAPDDTTFVALLDRATGVASPLVVEAYLPRFDPTGSRLAYATLAEDATGATQAFVVRDLASGIDAALGSVPILDLEVDFPSYDWLDDGRIAIGLGNRVSYQRDGLGTFVVDGVLLQQGANAVTARAIDPVTQLVSVTSEPVEITVVRLPSSSIWR